jgi:hypothetical protein
MTYILLSVIIVILIYLTIKIKKIMIDLTKITADVAANTNAVNSAASLLQELTALVKAIPPSSDPVTQAAIDNLATTMEANTANLANAIVTNTPAASQATGPVTPATGG